MIKDFQKYLVKTCEILGEVEAELGSLEE